MRWRKKGWVQRAADPRDLRIERYRPTSGASIAVWQLFKLRMTHDDDGRCRMRGSQVRPTSPLEFQPIGSRRY
jgi:hypothetical protein